MITSYDNRNTSFHYIQQYLQIYVKYQSDFNELILKPYMIIYSFFYTKSGYSPGYFVNNATKARIYTSVFAHKYLAENKKTQMSKNNCKSFLHFNKLTRKTRNRSSIII